MIELSAVDQEALQRSLALALALRHRVEQVQSMLAHDGWQETATFCSYFLQMDALRLFPGDTPPCLIESAEVDAILARGRSDFDYRAAVLARKLVDHGLSVYEPHPEAALRKKKPDKSARRMFKAAEAGETGRWAR